MRPANSQISLGIRPVWSESSQWSQWAMFLRADCEDSDQTGRMPRLMWVFAVHTDHFVGFVVRRLTLIRLLLGGFFVCSDVSVWKFRNITVKPKIKKSCVYCNISGLKWVGRSGFFFLNPNNRNAHIVTVIILHQHKFCVYKGKRKLKLLICTFCTLTVFIMLCKYFF